MESKALENDQGRLDWLCRLMQPRVDRVPYQPLRKQSSASPISSSISGSQPTSVRPACTLDHMCNRSRQHTRTASPSVKLSFQLIVRAEPTDMVLATLRSLIAIKHPSDEIIIIDNNHTQTALYEPLADYCAALDDRLNVHFYHIDAVAGFKAGALNLALGLMDPSYSHIVVVDSDYQALPHAREAITRAISAYPDHALLQFPQFYRDVGLADVHSELNHYFNHHIFRPFNRQRVLSTGTYAVIRRSALLALGGWSGESITEDAQMGMLMHRKGYKSQFIPQVIATGRLPMTLCDLVAQRQRWVYGNAQVLSTMFTLSDVSADRPAITGATRDATSDHLTSKAIGTDSVSMPSTSPTPAQSVTLTQSISARWQDLRAHLSQLSAWINFTGLFILLHLCTLLLVVTLGVLGRKVELSTVFLPFCIVYGAYAVFMLRRLWAYSQDRAPLNQQVNKAYRPTGRSRLRAWALHLSFWEVGALSWLPVLWGRDKPFVCTPKQDIARTERAVFLDNIRALPKLIAVLNIVTLVLVSPLTTLYSPLLFTAALIVGAVKLWSAKVAFDNYGYDALMSHRDQSTLTQPQAVVIEPIKPGQTQSAQ